MGKTSYQDSPSDYSDSESSLADNDKATNQVIEDRVNGENVTSLTFSDQDSPSLLKNCVKYGRTNGIFNAKQCNKKSLKSHTVLAERRISTLKEDTVSVDRNEEIGQVKSKRKQAPKEGQCQKIVQKVVRGQDSAKEG